MKDVKLVEILGPGCPRCDEAYRVASRVVEAAGLGCRVIKVADLDRMVALGVLATPAVAVDGRVVMSGRVPEAEEVRKLLDVP